MLASTVIMVEFDRRCVPLLKILIILKRAGLRGVDIIDQWAGLRGVDIVDQWLNE